ncbi:hypothetical protein SHVI106290_20110 [Shewanella violacea]
MCSALAILLKIKMGVLVISCLGYLFLTKTKYSSYYGLKHNEPSLSYLLNKEYD